MLSRSIDPVALLVCLFSLSGCSAGSTDSTVQDSTGKGNSGGQLNLGSGGSGSAVGGSSGPGVNLGGGLATGTGGGQSPDGEYCDGKLKGYVRDFSPYTHQDFEPFQGILDATGMAYPTARTLPATAPTFVDAGIVAAELGVNQKPTYGGGAATATTYGPTAFASWYSDTLGVNLGMELEFEFLPDPAQPGVFFYENPKFFPINGQLMAAAGAAENPDPAKRENEGFANKVNYGFTTEIHLTFEYSPGQVFSFRGDDDVFVFINKQRVINLGGVHQELNASVDLSTLNLVAGQVYPLDFFHAERHRTNSNFRIETSLKFVNCGTVVK